MDKRSLAEQTVISLYATAFLSVIIIGVYETYLHGFPPQGVFYLVPPGFIPNVPLYLQALPYNLVIFGCYALYLIKGYRLKALPMFFFVYCIWDMMSIPFNTMPLIYAAIYFPVLILSYALVLPKHHIVNVYTIAMLFWMVRQPMLTLIVPYSFAHSEVVQFTSYGVWMVLFFLFVRHSFSPSEKRVEYHEPDDGERQEAHTEERSEVSGLDVDADL